jgi:hypothetical protein
LWKGMRSARNERNGCRGKRTSDSSRLQSAHAGQPRQRAYPPEFAELRQLQLLSHLQPPWHSGTLHLSHTPCRLRRPPTVALPAWKARRDSEVEGAGALLRTGRCAMQGTACCTLGRAEQAVGGDRGLSAATVRTQVPTCLREAGEGENANRGQQQQRRRVGPHRKSHEWKWEGDTSARQLGIGVQWPACSL